MGSVAAARLVEDGVVEDEIGPLAGRPVLPVLLDDADAVARVARAAPACVVVGIAPAGSDLGLAPQLDVLLTDASKPPQPWVAHADGIDAALHDIREAVARSPVASVTLVQLLRLGRHLDVESAVVAESLAYSTLQSGPAFRAWVGELPARDTPLDPDPPVLVERRDDTLTIVLNRPRVRNAFNAAMRDGLVEAFRLVALDRSITSVEVRGTGPSFCSGGDLHEFGTLPDPATAHIIRTSRSAGLWVHRCRERASFRVHGACVGAGIEVPAFAQQVIAEAGASFRLPEVGMGLVPGAGGTASLPRRIGAERTAWLAISGATIDATTAFDWGLIDAVV